MKAGSKEIRNKNFSIERLLSKEETPEKNQTDDSEFKNHQTNISDQNGSEYTGKASEDKELSDDNKTFNIFRKVHGQDRYTCINDAHIFAGSELANIYFEAKRQTNFESLAVPPYSVRGLEDTKSVFQYRNRQFSTWPQDDVIHYWRSAMQLPANVCHESSILFSTCRRHKRMRTAFSPSQLLHLERAFESNHYVVGSERRDLASNLGLTETQVKVWFQNRRTKFKRIKTEVEVSKTLEVQVKKEKDTEHILDEHKGKS